jgi:hypothetical protein
MNGFAYWQYTLTAKAIVPKSPFRRQAAFTDSEDSAKGRLARRTNAHWAVTRLSPSVYLTAAHFFDRHYAVRQD